MFLGIFFFLLPFSFLVIFLSVYYNIIEAFIGCFWLSILSQILDSNIRHYFGSLIAAEIGQI